MEKMKQNKQKWKQRKTRWLYSKRGSSTKSTKRCTKFNHSLFFIMKKKDSPSCVQKYRIFPYSRINLGIIKNI